MKNKSKIKNKFKILWGMSLLEVMLSVFIFSIIILTTMGVAISYLKSRSSIKKYQQNVEEMSLAINRIAQKIRMSNCDDADVPCVFDGDEVTVAQNTGGGSLSYVFADSRLTENGHVVMENVRGRFFIRNQGRVPRVTIVIWKEDMPNSLVQTTVSLRSGYSTL